jgi:small multidrug resistance pump
MSWLVLVASIVLEVLATLSMKLSEGFSRPLYSALMALLYALSIAGLALVIKRIEVSVAYAVWSGLGTALIAMVGVIFIRPLYALG